MTDEMRRPEAIVRINTERKERLLWRRQIFRGEVKWGEMDRRINGWMDE